MQKIAPFSAMTCGLRHLLVRPDARVLARKHAHAHVGREPYPLAAGDRHQLRHGHALRLHHAHSLVRAKNRRAGRHCDPLGTVQVIEVGVPKRPGRRRWAVAMAISVAVAALTATWIGRERTRPRPEQIFSAEARPALMRLGLLEPSADPVTASARSELTLIRVPIEGDQILFYWAR